MYEWGVYFSLTCQVRGQSVYFPATILFNKLKGWEPGKRVWTGCVLSICQINNRAWKQQILLIRQDGVLLPLKCYIALIFIFYSDTNYCKRFREWSKIKSCGIIHNVKIAWINLSAAPRPPTVCRGTGGSGLASWRILFTSTPAPTWSREAAGKTWGFETRSARHRLANPFSEASVFSFVNINSPAPPASPGGCKDLTNSQEQKCFKMSEVVRGAETQDYLLEEADRGGASSVRVLARAMAGRIPDRGRACS